MAILTDVPGLNIEIRARGQELAEHYPDEEECHSKTVTKYIEAVTNEEFEVSLSVPKHFKFFEYDLAVQVYLDGEFADALVLKEVEMRKGLHTRIGGVKRYDGLKWQQRNFRFAHLQTSEYPETLVYTLKNLDKRR